MDKNFKHGPELRQFWKEQKAKYREKKKAREVQAANSTTSQAPSPPTTEEDRLVA